MTIKEVSEKFDISQDTLRYYEKIGLISKVPRKSGIRNYGEEELKNIEFVICMRNAGLSIEALAEYLSLFKEGNKTIELRRNILIRERDKLALKIEDMKKAYERLNYKIDVYYSVILQKEKETFDKK